MCIIIAKEKLGRLPSEEELKNSFEYNSDGAGFMYTKKGKVVIDKGYMTWDSFYKHYNQLLQEFNNFKNKSLVIHCRIGTSGQKIRENTHPYPISSDTRKLRAKKLSQENIGIVHNGIIQGYGTATGLNDTQEFISKYIYPIYSHFKDFYKNKDIMYGIQKITNSKFVIMDTKDNLYYIGDFIDDKSLKFSNTSYKRVNYKYSSYHYGIYGDYYDDWYDKEYARQLEFEEKDKKEIDNEDYLIQLEKDWFVDYYGDGELEKVGDKELWYNYDTLELFEYKNGAMDLVGINPLIYDELSEELF